MHIVRLQSENFKRLIAVAITPDSSVIRVTGANGSGKSSLLDSIYCALAGKSAHPSQPIRRGQERATITLDLGTITVIRRFTAGGTTLTIESKDGAVFRSPQAMLDGMLGELTFDPLAFSRLPAKQQLEQLRSLVHVDVDLDALDAQIERAYAERTEKNRLVKSLREAEAQAAARVEPTMETELVNVSALVAQLEQATQANAAIEAHAAEIVNQRAQMERCSAEMARITMQIAELEARFQEVEREHTAIAGALNAVAPLQTPIDTSLLRLAINEAHAENTKREAQERARAEHRDVHTRLTAAVLEAGTLSNEIEDATAIKQDAIARAHMPVPGLSFGDGEITFNGIPLAQASSAEQIRVATAIGMALNPKLRILCIKDGSLLDAASLALVSEMADTHGYQVWMECVDTSGAVGIHMVDGSVASIDGEPVEPLVLDAALEVA